MLPLRQTVLLTLSDTRGGVLTLTDPCTQDRSGFVRVRVGHWRSTVRVSVYAVYTAERECFVAQSVITLANNCSNDYYRQLFLANYARKLDAHQLICRSLQLPFSFSLLFQQILTCTVRLRWYFGYYAPACRKGAVSVDFVRPSVRPSHT